MRDPKTILEGGFLPWQSQAIKCIIEKKCDILLLTGGFGSGKTAVNATIVRELLLKDKLEALVIGTSFSIVRDAIDPVIIDESSFAIDNKATKYSSPIRWGYISGSNLLSRTMQYNHEVQRRIKSLNIDILWLFEATELPEYAYKIGISRLRKSGDKAYYPVLIETNPSHKNHWVYKSFIEGSNQVWESKDKTYSISKKVSNYDGKQIKVIIFNITTLANPYFPKQILAQMRASYSASEYERLVYGVWNALEGRVWETYKTFPHPGGRQKEYAEKYDDILIGIDPGQTDPTAMVLIGFCDGVYEVFDEYREQQRSVREIRIELMKRLESWGISLERQFEVWVDPSGSQWIREWNEIPGNENYYAYASRHRGTDPAKNRAIKLGEMLRTWRLIINDHCRNVIDDIEQATYKEGSIKEEIDKMRYNPHSMDAVGYALNKKYGY